MHRPAENKSFELQKPLMPDVCMSVSPSRKDSSACMLILYACNIQCMGFSSEGQTLTCRSIAGERDEQ
jgi:hypothetical protein